MSFLKFYILLFVLLLSSIKSISQNIFTISGIVTDSNQKPIPFATIILIQNKNNEIINYVLTNEGGEYSINFTNKNNDLLLKVSSLGYENDSINVSMSKSILYNFILKSKITILREVIVKASSSKVIASNDTVTFKADAYRDNTEKVTEDLLKKIPGIDVSKDGSISVNGKKIEKILIEGDDLFNKNYTLLSKNLSADLIDKIQVIDKYIDNPLLKGMVNSDNKVLNITLKNERKKILFGNSSVGAGNNNRYDAAANFISFYKKIKIFVFGNYNTIGKDPIPEISNNVELEESFNNQEASETFANNLVEIQRALPQDFERKRINFNHSKLGSLSFINKPSDKIQIKGLGYVFGDKTLITQINNYSYTTNSSIININETNRYQQTPFLLNGHFNLKYTPKENEQFDYTLSTRYSTLKTGADMISNNVDFFNIGNDKNLLQNHKIDYTKRINQRNVLLIAGVYSKLDKKQDFDLQQNVARQLPFTNSLFANLYQSVSYPQILGKLSTKYIHGNSSNNISLETGILFKKQMVISSLDTITNLNQKNLIQDTFKNNLSVSQLNYFLTLSNTKQLFQNIKLTTELSANYQIVNSDDNRNQSSTSAQNFLYYIPKLGLKWSKGNNSLSTTYSYNTRLPEITDLYTGFILSDYRTFKRGSEIYRLSNTHVGLVNYTYANWSKQIIVYASYIYIGDRGILNNQYSLSNNYDLISRIAQISKQQTSIYALGIDKFIPFLSSSLKLKENITKTNYQNQINNTGNREIKSLSTNTQLSLRSALKGFFNFNTGSILNYSKSNVSYINGTTSFDNTTLQNFIDMNLKISKKWTAQINTEHYYFNSIKNYKKSYFFIDFSTQFNLQDNKILFTLRGHNLLNNNVFLNTSISDFSIQTQQYNLLHAYLLLEINYRF